MRTFTLVLSLFSYSALACPNLSGLYPTCRSNNGNVDIDYDVQVTQDVVNGATEFTVSSTDAETNQRSTYATRADGITRTESVEIPEFGVTVEVSATASCTSDTLLVATATNLQGNPMGATSSKIWKVGNELHQETTGEMMGQPINELVICY